MARAVPTVFDVTDHAALGVAVKALAKRCEVIRAAHAYVGVPEWRTRPGGYAGLARIIAYQQLSTKAAGTIWGRVEKLVGKVTPRSVLDADFDALRACGLSRPKIAHIRSIAQAVADRRLNLSRVARASDADAQAADYEAVVRLVKENEELKDRALRLAAEMENLRRRTGRDSLRRGCRTECGRRAGRRQGRERAVPPGAEERFEPGEKALQPSDDEGGQPIQPQGARRRPRQGGAEAGEARLGGGWVM